MTRTGDILSRAAGEPWTVVSVVLRAAALAALALLLGHVVVSVARGEFAALGDAGTLARLAAARVVYLSGHALRVVRLAMLIGAWQAGFRQVASFHFFTAAVSLVVPLKLGEIYRVAELSNLTHGPVRAVVIVWWERAFDIAAILVLLLAALATSNGSSVGELGGVTAIATLCMLVTAVVFFVVPENLRRLSILIIRRYATARAVPVLALTDRARRAILEAPRVVENKVASLVTLTALIWTCEALCFAIAIPALSNSFDEALAALLGFLSSVTRGETWFGAFGAGAGDVPMSALSYLAATQAPLVVLGAAAGVYYIVHGRRAGAAGGRA